MKNTTLQEIQGLQNLNILETEFYRPFIKHFEGFEYHEIAYILEIPVATVKQRIKLARRALNYHLDTYVADNRMQLNN